MKAFGVIGVGGVLKIYTTVLYSQQKEFRRGKVDRLRNHLFE